MTDSGSGWKQLLDAIEAVNKYVALDLSACTMAGIEFNPDYTVSTGKDKIVSIILPDTALSIVEAFISSNHPPFKSFSSLKSLSAARLTSIGNSAFNGCTSLTQVTLPASLTSIGNGAFEGCTSLTQVTLPASLTSLGNYAFEDCTSLTQVTLPASLTSLGYNPFENCDDTLMFTITGSGDLAAIENGKALVWKNELISYPSASGNIVLPSNITSIGEFVFNGCTSLTQVTFPASLTSIGDFAFNGCTSLTQVTFPASLTSIGYTAFNGCTSLTQVTFPASLTSIDGDAFHGCTSLTQVTLPASLTSIGDAAFHGCTSLTQVTLPASLTSIGLWAFDDCDSLALVTCNALIPPTSFQGNTHFLGYSSSLVIKVPMASVDAYKTAELWRLYADKIVGF